MGRREGYEEKWNGVGGAVQPDEVKKTFLGVLGMLPVRQGKVAVQKKVLEPLV